MYWIDGPTQNRIARWKKSLFFIPLIFKLETFSSPPFHWAFIGRAKPLVTNYFTSSSPILRSLYWLKGHELCGIGLLQIFAWNRDKVLKGLQALLECWTNKAGVLIGNKKIQMKAENEALNVSIRPSRSTLPNYCSVRRIKHRLANETPNLPMNWRLSRAKLQRQKDELCWSGWTQYVFPIRWHFKVKVNEIEDALY